MQLRKFKAFGSTFVLMFFMLISLIITSYMIIIRNNLEIIDNLTLIEKQLIDKTKIIYKFKQLDLNEDIKSFSVEDIFVDVVKIEDSYHLNYENHQIILKVVNNRIYEMK